MSINIFADNFKQSPFWWEDSSPRVIQDELPEDADVVVVGGGYAGLSTALELGRNGTNVVVLESYAFGNGASSRNGGAVSGANVGKGSSAVAVSPIERSLGKERMLQLLAGGVESVANLETIINREKINCHYIRCGQFVGAYTPTHFKAMSEKVQNLNSGGNGGAALLSRHEQRRELATDFYFGGMTLEDTGSLHPAMLNMGLLERCQKYGVILCANTSVLSISQEGSDYLVATSRGIIKGRDVVIGTNGYTGKSTPWLRRRLIQAGSYIIATEERSEEEMKELIPNNRTIADSKRVLNYYRLSPDGRRVLFGGRARLSPGNAVDRTPILFRQMLNVFPQLSGIKLTHAWTGGVAFTFDFLPHMGRHKGVHYMAGCNGSGIAMMTYLGTQTALKILGKANHPCIFDDLRFDSRVFYTGHAWFLPIVSSYYALRDHFDRFRAV